MDSLSAAEDFAFSSGSGFFSGDLNCDFHIKSELAIFAELAVVVDMNDFCFLITGWDKLLASDAVDFVGDVVMGVFGGSLSRDEIAGCVCDGLDDNVLLPRAGFCFIGTIFGPAPTSALVLEIDMDLGADCCRLEKMAGCLFEP